MAIYSIGRRTSNVTSGATGHGILTASSRRVILLEAGVFMGATTASTYSLGRPAAAGVTPGTQALFQAEDPNSVASVTNSNLTYGTSPTSPTNALRRISTPGTIGTGAIFTFPRGVVISVSSEFVLQNEALNGVVDSYFVIDE